MLLKKIAKLIQMLISLLILLILSVEPDKNILLKFSVY